MTNTDDLLLRIKGCKEKTLTTKTLLELDINNYYIKKLLDEGLLLKTGRGMYEVNTAFLEEQKENEEKVNSFTLFNAFKGRILNSDYENAYKYLIENLSLQKGHEYDNHARIYLLLLKEILGDNYDFSILDSLLEFSEINNDTYYNNFISFRNSVMERDFYLAKRYLDEFARIEFEKNGYNNVSTTLFSHLLNAVIDTNDKVNVVNERVEKSKALHREFVNYMKANDWNKALEFLEECIEYTDDDTNIKSFKREREILLDIIYLSTSDGVIEYGIAEYNKNDFANLILAIKVKDYLTALEFANKLLKEKVTYTVINLKYLVDKVIYYNNLNLKKIEEEKRKVRNIELANKSISAYKCFQYAFDHEKYDEALSYLRISIEANPDKNHELNNRHLLNMFEYLVKMMKEKIGFQDKNIEYDSSLTTTELFNLALDNEDYRTALRNIGKLTYQNDSKVLDLFKTILHMMLDLDNKYGNKKKEILDSKRVEKSGAVMSDEKSNNFNSVNTQKVQIYLTDELISDYVYDRKYEELFRLLWEKKQRNVELDRLEFFSLRLIRVLKEVQSNKYEDEHHVYKVSTSDPLRRMYEAIKCKDYPEVKSCIEYIKTFMSDLFEINVYEMIVEDIYDEVERQQRKKEEDDHLNKLTNKAKSLIDKKNNFSNEEIDELYQVYGEIIELRDKPIYKIFISILELIDLANNSILDNTYFERFECNEKDYDAKINYFLNVGDYLSALEIMKKADFDKILKNVHFNDKLLLKRLLYILERALNKPFVYEQVQFDQTEEDEKIKNIEKLKDLKRLLKKRDFYGAFNFYLNNTFKDNMLDEFVGDLIISYVEALKEEKELYQQCLEAIEQNKEIRLKYNNYLEYINATTICEKEDINKRKEELSEKVKNLI